MSEARASLLSGDVVELTNATAVDSTSAKLSWDVSESVLKTSTCGRFSWSISLCLAQIINGRYVEGFYIYARNIDYNEQPSYKMLTVLQNAGSGASSCKIGGLQKFATYEFFVVPFYKAVEGKPSNSRIARTLEDGEFH